MKTAATQSNPGVTALDGRALSDWRRRAFTLLEVLISILIFAILLAAIDGLLFGALHLQAKANQAIDDVLPADRAVKVIKRDIANAIFMTNGLICGGVYGGTYQGDGQNNLPMGGLATPVNLSIYTTAGVVDDDNYWGEIARVDYSLQTASNRASAGRDLVRTVTHNPLTLSQEVPEQLRLLENVQNLTVTFFDTTNWNDSWGDPNSVTASNMMPSAIKMRVEFAADRGSRPATPLDLTFPIMVSLVNTNLQ